MRSPTLPPMRMKAADTSASRAMADWTPLTVVPMSSTTAEMDTFMRDVSTTSTNMAMASSSASRWSPACSPAELTAASRSCAVGTEVADQDLAELGQGDVGDHGHQDHPPLGPGQLDRVEDPPEGADGRDQERERQGRPDQQVEAAVGDGVAG